MASYTPPNIIGGEIESAPLNQNEQATKVAVDDNDTRISTNTSNIALKADKTALDVETAARISGDNVLDTNKLDKTIYNAHVAGTSDKHGAEDINYNGSVVADNVKDAIDANDSRISNIIAQSGTSDTEVVDSRESPYYDTTYAVLKDRLDNIETSKAEDNKINNSSGYLPSDFYGNVKTILACEESREDITFVAGAYSQSNVKIGKDSISSLTGVLQSQIGVTFNTSQNLSKFNDNTDINSDSFVTIPITITGTTPTQIVLEIGTSTTRDVDEFQKNFTIADNDFKVLKAKFSDFLEVGTPDISNINRISILAVGGDVTTQFFIDEIQFVKADPETKSYPQPFQINGRSVADVLGNAEFAVVKEFGKPSIVMLKPVDSGTPTPALKFKQVFDDFTAISSITLKTGFSTFQELASMHSDNSNNLFVRYSGTPVDTLELVSVVNGVVTTFVGEVVPFDNGDTLDVIIHKQGNDVNVTIYRNNDTANPYHIKGTTTLTGLSQAFKNISSREFDINYAGVTELPFTARSGYAFRAGSLDEQQFVQVRTLDVQSIPDDDAWHDVVFPFDSADNNFGILLDDGVTFELKEAGKYIMHALLAFNQSAITGVMQIRIYRGDNTMVAGDSANAIVESTQPTIVQCMDARRYSDGTTFKVQAKQSSGSSLDIQAYTGYSNEFFLAKIG